MNELSRSDKVASAQEKLKKFRKSRNNSKNTLRDQNTELSGFHEIPSNVSHQHKGPVLDHDFGNTHQYVKAEVSSGPQSLADYFTGSSDNTFRGPQEVFEIPNFPAPNLPSHNPSLTLAGPQPVFVEVAPAESHTGENRVIPCSESTVFRENAANVYSVPFVQANGIPEENCILDSNDKTPTAATEKLLQLSSQLAGILQVSEQLSSTFTPGCSQSGFIYTSPKSSGNPEGDSSTISSSFGEYSPSLTDVHNTPTAIRSPTPSSANGLSRGTNYVRELEDRNVELASLLEKRNRALERALAKVSTLQEQASRASSQAASARTELEKSSARDLAKAHEQIRAHAQTVGVLVAEKTELAAKVTHLERLATDRGKELDATNERLRTFREQILESDRKLASLQSNLDRASAQNAELNLQLDRMKCEVERESKVKENSQAELRDTIVRLNMKTNESLQLNARLSELQRQLELVQIYSNQMRPAGQLDEGASDSFNHTRETWLKERANLVQRIKELEESALQANKDRARLESQYKTIVSQLEQQLSTVRAELTSVNRSHQELESSFEDTRRSLREKEEELLEYQCKLQRPVNEPSSVQSESCFTDKQVCDHLPKLAELTEGNERLQQDLERQTAELISVKEQLHVAREIIREKDTLLTDRDRVLESATADRAVLSRAMEQNKNLKAQLTELQDSLTRMSSENVELSSKLEKHVATCNSEGSNHGASIEHPPVTDDVSSRLELLDCLENKFKLLHHWIREQHAAPEDTEIHAVGPLDCFMALERTIRATIIDLHKEVAAQAEQNRQHFINSETLPTCEQWQSLQRAHEQLEAKFVECMHKLSRSTEERNRLEAIVEHLEMEAASVGEYVTLFAHRRAAAANRAKAREELIRRLVADRRQLRSRLMEMRDVMVQNASVFESSENNQVRTVSHDLGALLEEIASNNDDIAVAPESDEHDDDDECSTGMHECGEQATTLVGSELSLEQLRKQALQHDCPHCKCCVGTLLEV